MTTISVSTVQLAASSLRADLQTIGTVGAVVLALFLQLWRPYMGRPRLRLQDFDATTDIVDDLAGKHGELGIWVHLRVLNYGRRESAVDVELVLAKCSKSDVELRPYKWSHAHSAQAAVAAGLERHIDFGTVRRFDRSADVEFQVETYPRIGSDRNRLSADAYDFVVALTAANAKAHWYAVHLVFRPTDDDTFDALENAVKLLTIAEIAAPRPLSVGPTPGRVAGASPTHRISR